MKTITRSETTEGQFKQLVRVAQDGTDKAVQEAVASFLAEYDLTNDGAQLILKSGNIVSSSLRATVHKTLFDVYKRLSAESDGRKFATEEEDSDCDYPKGYEGPKPIEEQIAILAKELGLSPDKAFRFAKEVLPNLTLPKRAEGWFAIPYWYQLAERRFPDAIGAEEKYCRSIDFVFKKIKETTEFKDRRGSYRTGPSHVRQNRETRDALDRILQEQRSEILIIPAQFGRRHRGRSVRRARECFWKGEFSLGALEVGAMLLTHPERRVRLPNLGMLCSGSEACSDKKKSFDEVLYIQFDAPLQSGYCPRWISWKNFGAVTGFLTD